MKTNLYLMTLTLAAALVSCDKVERPSDAKSEDVYEEAFVKAVGEYSRSNTWNTARQFRIDVAPASGSGVKVYAPCRDEYRLVASYSRPSQAFTATFDAPASSGRFVVALGDGLYYAEPDGNVSQQSPSAAGAKVSDEPLRWIIAVENDFDASAKSRRNAGQIDFDFNDLVIGMSSVVTDDHVSLDFEPLACGDNQPFHLHIRTDAGDQLLWQMGNGNTTDCEYHQWFGVLDHTTGVNTGTNASDQKAPWAAIPTVEAITAAMSGCHIEMPSFWTLSNYSHMSRDYQGRPREVWGLYVTVGTYKGYDLIKDSDEYGLICAEPGRAPRMILFPDTGVSGKWRWPCEGNMLSNCYQVFGEWGMDPSNPQKSLWHEWIPAPGTVRERY